MGIVGIEQSEWQTGTTFGTPAASVVPMAKYGNRSGMVEVQVPASFPDGGGSTDDFFTVLAIRESRSTAEIVIDQSDAPPSAALTKSLAQTVAAKM